MAPTPDEFSDPGSVSYNSDTMTVGDGTWDFTKNTFLLPNLVGTNFETTKYNGMGNRFSSLSQYHMLILAHGILAALVFLLIIPAAVMTVRFYHGRPGWAVKYHARMQIVAGILLVVVFVLGNIAVGPKRSLTNPHHGIGVAIFVIFWVQFLGGAIIHRITKARSVRVTLHQWLGRSLAILGIVQIPLGLTLYGSPKYLYIMYAVWGGFLVVLYFILNFRSGVRREYLRDGPARSEYTEATGRTGYTGRTRMTETEYLESEAPTGHDHGNKKWLGLAALGAWFAFRNKKNKGDDKSRGSMSEMSRGPEVVPSRRGSASYVTGYDDETEKFTEVGAKKSGGFMKIFGGAAAALGAGKFVSGLMNRREDRHDEYSAVSTETPRRNRTGRGVAQSEMTSDYTEDPRQNPTSTLLSPSGHPATTMTGGRSAGGSVRPSRPSHARRSGRRRSFEDSEYSSYVSPSRRIPDEPRSGASKGILAGLGLGFIGKKLAERKAKKEEEKRLRDEEDMRSGVTGSRYTGDGHPSPTRKPTRRPTVRRPTGIPSQVTGTEMTESSIDDTATSFAPPPAPVPSSRVRSGSRSTHEPVSMPPMPTDPHGVLHSEADSSFVSEALPRRRESSRRRRAGERATAAAAARASELAAETERFSSPVSVKLKVHDDRDRNVTLRRLTEEEARAVRGRSRADSDSSVDSPSGRYRRDTSPTNTAQRRAEAAAESEVEDSDGDTVGNLPPPNPSFAKGRRAGKDSAYYSGPPGAGQTQSSLGPIADTELSHGTWSEMSPSPGRRDKAAAGVSGGEGSVSAADNRRRRRLERRRGSGSRPSQAEMFD